MNIRRELTITLAAFAAIWLAGCGGSAAQRAENMTSYSASAQDRPELFSLTADQISHIQIVTVATAPVVRSLRLSGAVDYNSFKTTPVISQVGGPVNRMVVVPGQNVRAGEPMLYVASPDYSVLRSAYFKAKDALRLADRAYTRAEDLYAHKAISQADLEAAESARAQAQADLESSTDALHVLGIADPDSLMTRSSMPEVPMLAPVAGEVVERTCNPGQLLQPGATQCFTITDMSSVWILANVYQNDLAYVHVGDAVSVTNEAYPGEIRGKIEYLAPGLDPATRTLQARIEAPNPSRRLKRQMYVTVLVRAGTIPNAIAVPDAAVLRDAQNMPFVYVQMGNNNQFGRRNVTIGGSQDGKTQIVSGLQPDERVVGDGSLFLQFQNSMQR